MRAMTTKTKKALAMVLALVVLLTMPMAGLAATITAPADNTHTYEIYQIFTGDVATEGDAKTLSNVKWGQNGKNGTTAVTAGTAVAAEVLEELNEAISLNKEAKLQKIQKYVDTTGTPVATLKGTTTSADVKIGYYYIVDIAPDGALYSSDIVKVLDSALTISPKTADIPKVYKQVQDEEADMDKISTTTDPEAHDNGFGETADHAMFEVHKYRLLADLRETGFETFTKYQIRFHDDMTDAITFVNKNTITVMAYDQNHPNGVEIPVSGYTLTPEGDNAMNGVAGLNWTLTIPDVKQYLNTSTDAKVVVTYDGYLNETAAIGNNPGNKNSVYLTYTTNPKWDGTGDWKYGTTTEDHVWVFTYVAQNTKVDGEDQPLAGAGFRLYWYSDNGANGTNRGTEIPLVKDGDAYRPVKGQEAGQELTSAADGRFDIKGLDAGKYVLVETTTPAGYNTCADIVLEITAVHQETEGGNSAGTTITYKQDNDVVQAIKVVNNKGLVLPETGGMGTTLFYLVGGLLMVGAVVVLITRKRMAGFDK